MREVDISRFRQTFFEESAENLDSIESMLLALNPASVDTDSVHAIFRAAHSIKGGAGTFGLGEISSFTHLLETLLDEMRAGQRSITQPGVDLMLRAFDVLRGMLDAARAGQPTDVSGVAAMADELRGFMAVAQVVDAGASDVISTPQPSAGLRHWRIRFVPDESLFLSGNDPLMILRELERLGHLQVRCDDSRLPSLAVAEADHCYLGWDIELHADCTREAIAEAFAWVEDECELSIVDDTPMPASVERNTSAATIPPSATAAMAASASGPVSAAGSVAAGRERKAAAGADSVRVSTGKIDQLINLTSELVITQAMLQQLAAGMDPLENEKMLTGLSQLERNTRALQEAVMSTRMLPMEVVFNRFPRVVHDMAAKLDKSIELRTSGESTELDKSMIERIVDPLTHLVRNAIDHGIERCEQRVAAGKPSTATVTLSAAHQGGHIVIEVEDDGRGLDRERILAKAESAGMPVSPAMSDEDVWKLIFAPGLSTADKVTDISGRGVGMDVVKQNIEALSGSVEITSRAGSGTRVTIRLPLTLAILDGMSVRIGGEIFILPLGSVVESLQPQRGQIRSLTGKAQVLRLREEYVPVLALHELFGIHNAVRDPHAGIIVVLESGGRHVAALADELVGQRQVVIKSLEANYRRVPCMSGATILGDGTVALIVDVAEIVRVASRAQAA